MYILPLVLLATLAYVARKDAEKAFFLAAAFFHIGLFLNLGQGFDVSLIRVVVLMFLIFFGVLFIKGRIKIKKEPLGAALVAFLFIGAFSLFYAPNFSFGIRKAVYFFSVIPFYFVVLYFADSLEKIKKLIKINIIMAGVVSLAGTVQFMMQFFFPLEAIKRAFVAINPLIYGKSFGWLVVQTPSWFVNIGGKDFFRNISIFPDPHTYALYLGLIIPLAASALYFKLFKEKTIIWISLVLSVFALITTFSRGGYISLFVLAAVFGIFNYKKLPKKKIFSGVLLMLLAVILFALSPAGTRLGQTFDLQERSVSGRLQILAESLSLWKDNFIFGTGIGNYSYAVNNVASYRSPINAHNTYLEIATELGLVGLLVWLFIVFMLVFGLVVFLKKMAGPDNKEYFAIGLGLLGGFACYFTNSLFETALYWPVVLAVFVENTAITSYLLFNKENA
jgi:O-antigen ligase